MEPNQRETVEIEEARIFLFDNEASTNLPRVEDTILGSKDAPIGILLQHGFAGSNLEMLYLGNQLALQGYRVLIPVLPGHGTNSGDLIGVTYHDWIKKHREGYNYLRNELQERKIIAIGHSLGGTLSLNLAADIPDLNAVISIAGPIEFTRFERLLVKIGGRLPIKYPYEDFLFFDERLYHHPSVEMFNKNYGKMPMEAIRQVFELLAYTKKKLKKIHIPVYLINSKHDPTVPPYHLYRVLKGIASNRIEITWLEESYHIIVVDNDRDRLAENIIRFINQVA